MGGDDGVEVLIIFPPYEDLKQEIEKLRTELSMLVLERDQIRFVECPNIEAAYLMELGALEYRAYEAQCAYLRLRRKADLIQAFRNRQERVDLAAVEERLDAEFAAFQKMLDARIRQMNEAVERSRMEVLSQEQTREFKALYRTIVKALHPDLHPDISPERLELFHRAVEAYKSGDLLSLRVIGEMVSEPVWPDPQETQADAMTVLVREHDRLKGLLDGVRESIAELKEEYPYTLKALIADREKLEARREELQVTLDRYREFIRYYEERIRELLR